MKQGVRTVVAFIAMSAFIGCSQASDAKQTVTKFNQLAAAGDVKGAISLTWQGERVLEQLQSASDDAMTLASQNMQASYAEVSITVGEVTCLADEELRNGNFPDDIIGACEVSLTISPLNGEGEVEIDVVDVVDTGAGWKLVVN